MQFILMAVSAVGAVSIIFTVCSLVRLNDYLYEVYGYDRDQDT